MFFSRGSSVNSFETPTTAQVADRTRSSTAGRASTRSSISRGSSVTSFDSTGSIKRTPSHSLLPNNYDCDAALPVPLPVPVVEQPSTEPNSNNNNTNVSASRTNNHKSYPELKNNKKRRKSWNEMVNDFLSSEDMPVVELPTLYSHSEKMMSMPMGFFEERDRERERERYHENGFFWSRSNSQQQGVQNDHEDTKELEQRQVERDGAEEEDERDDDQMNHDEDKMMIDLENQTELMDDGEDTCKELITLPPTVATTSSPITNKPTAFHERHHFEFFVIVFGGAALAFNAGFINGCTFQLGSTFVSHITGMTTRAGIQLGYEEYVAFGQYMLLIVCFIFGAFLSGFMMRQETFQLGREYGPLFLIGSFLFALDCLSMYYIPNMNISFYFAAMGCGLQNGLTTKYSGSIIRTTHMTGAGTDIGLVLGRIAQGDNKEKWKLFVLIPLFFMFMFGSLTSVFAVARFGKLALLINVFLFLSIGIAYSIVVGQELHIPFWRALFGLYIVAEKGAKQAMKRVVRKVKISNNKATTRETKPGLRDPTTETTAQPTTN